MCGHFSNRKWIFSASFSLFYCRISILANASGKYTYTNTPHTQHTHDTHTSPHTHYPHNTYTPLGLAFNLPLVRLFTETAFLFPFLSSWTVSLENEKHSSTFLFANKRLYFSTPLCTLHNISINNKKFTLSRVKEEEDLRWDFIKIEGKKSSLKPIAQR